MMGDASRNINVSVTNDFAGWAVFVIVQSTRAVVVKVFNLFEPGLDSRAGKAVS